MRTPIRHLLALSITAALFVPLAYAQHDEAIVDTPYAVAAAATKVALDAAGRGTSGAAGTTRGLSILGGRGLLKGNSVSNGVITAGLLMIVVGAGTKFVLSRGQNERVQRMRALEVQVAEGHQRAIEDLGADLASLSQQVSAYRDRTAGSEAALAAAQRDVDLVAAALDHLEARQRALTAGVRAA